MTNVASAECQPAHDYELLATAMEWGLDGATLSHKTPIPAESLEGWETPGYLYECIGVVLAEGEVSRHPGILTLRNLDGSGMAMTAYRVRAYRIGGRLFWEKVFHADGSVTIDLRGIVELPSTADLEKEFRGVQSALGVLTALDQQAERLSANAIMPVEAFRLSFWQCLDSWGHARLSKGAVARKLAMHRETLDAYLVRAKIDWDQARLDRQRRRGAISMNQHTPT